MGLSRIILRVCRPAEILRGGSYRPAVIPVIVQAMAPQGTDDNWADVTRRPLRLLYSSLTESHVPVAQVVLQASKIFLESEW